MTTLTKGSKGRAGARGGGRGLDQLLADHGVEVPRVPAPEPQAPRERVFDKLVPQAGPHRPGAGWAASLPPVPGFEMTSEQVAVLWPLITGLALPPWGAPMGEEYFSGGGTFYCDPHGWVADDEIPVTSPNIFIKGKPGRGKSALIKSLILRLLPFFYRALILGDLKDEYEKLCHALGVEPFRIGFGLPGRINPLDMGPLGAGWRDLDAAEVQRRIEIIFPRWLSLIRGLVASQSIGTTPVPFGPSEESAVREALAELTGYNTAATTLRPVTIPQLWARLDEPTDQMWQACRYTSREEWWASTRLLRDALGVLCKGSLTGLFDAPTTFNLDWSAPIQSLSLSALRDKGDDVVGIALMCLNSWGSGMAETAKPGEKRINVRDEAWRQMRLGVAAVQALDSSLRLSRDAGHVEVVAMHKDTDPLGVGDAGSQSAQIAKDLMRLADIRIELGQDPPTTAADDAHLAHLSPEHRQVVTGWCMQRKGRSLWTLGELGFKVQHQLTSIESDLTYTNEAVA